ncbi:hypothetical protein Bpfe_031212 [Biomphalaria pfeifferi]|uniref:Uncharacterized protein n=1 Tax=Biomphalaria pfeifferi TaxID=112525 RepID=A0AAD8EUL9_BIOPF|nr:hypothetical protein Bpfe_031212 [Biomphalaria pfeifferi]
MSDKSRNILDAAERVEFFLIWQTRNCEPNCLIRSNCLTANKNNIERLNQAGIVSASAEGAGKSGTRSKVAYAEDMENDIRMVAKTAKTIKTKFPDFQNTFILPRGDLSYDDITAHTESFIADAAAHNDKFSLYALNQQFFTELGAKLTGFRTSSQNQADGKRTKVGATAEQEAALKETLVTIKELDRALKNHYRNNPQKFAEWQTASRIRRRSESDAPEPEPNNNG